MGQIQDWVRAQLIHWRSNSPNIDGVIGWIGGSQPCNISLGAKALSLHFRNKNGQVKYFKILCISQTNSPLLLRTSSSPLVTINDTHIANLSHNGLDSGDSSTGRSSLHSLIDYCLRGWKSCRSLSAAIKIIARIQCLTISPILKVGIEVADDLLQRCLFREVVLNVGQTYWPAFSSALILFNYLSLHYPIEWLLVVADLYAKLLVLFYNIKIYCLVNRSI